MLVTFEAPPQLNQAAAYPALGRAERSMHRACKFRMAQSVEKSEADGALMVGRKRTEAVEYLRALGILWHLQQLGARPGDKLILFLGSNEQFKSLCEVLLLPELIGDARFGTNAARVVNRDKLAGALAPAIAREPRAGLLARFRLAGVPAGAVNSIDQALDTPVARAMVIEEMIDGIRTLRIRGNAFRIDPFDRA